MVKQEFEPTEGLLEDVMRKQAGSVEKAVLEAVMNSVDANASHISITLEEGGHEDFSRIIIEDDGDGMTEEEVNEYFRKFGLKADDIEDKEFGKFRIGRGQIFNFGQNIWHSLDNLMVVNLDEEVCGVHEDLIGDISEDEVEERTESLVYVDTTGLSYNLLNASSRLEGCRIEVIPYSQVMPDAAETASKVKDLIKYIPWVHDVEIELNGGEVFFDPEPDFETDLAWYSFYPDAFGSNTSIYNQGAYVKKERFCNIESEIITKADLEVNFARNDILDTDENYRQILDECSRSAVSVLAEQDRLSSSQKRWMIEMAGKHKDVFEEIRDVPLIETVVSGDVPLQALDGETISFSRKGNKQAEYIQEETGILIVADSFRGPLEGIVEPESLRDYADAVEEDTRWEMDEYDYSDLSKRRRSNFDRAEWFLEHVGFSGPVTPGYSMHADVWKTDEGELFIDKAYLNESKKEFVINNLIHILEIAAQDGDTREGLSHGYSFTESFWNYMKHAPELQVKLLDGNAP